MQLTVKQEFKKLIPPLTFDEFKTLEANILNEGIRDPLTIWGDVLLDGHNRYEIATKHNIPFATVERFFDGDLDAKIWMINNQFGRRNLSNYQRSVLALEMENVFSEKAKEKQKEAGGAVRQISDKAVIDTKKELANVAKVSHDTIAKVKVIQAKATEEVKEKLSSGNLSINEAYKEIKTVEKAAEIREKKQQDELLLQTTIKVDDYDFIHNKSILDCVDVIPNGIRVLLTDPPYGQGFVSNRRVISEKDKGIANDDNIEDALILLDKTLNIMYDKMQNNSFAFVFTSWRYEPEFRAVFEKYFDLRSSIIWVKNNHGSGDINGAFAPKHERILFGVKGNPKLKYRLPDVLNGDEIITAHATAKPIDLLRELIKVTSVEGDIIAEPFAGHGSTIIAALDLHRKVFASEIDINNYNHIIKALIVRFS